MFAPLKNIRVLDLTRLMPAYTGMMLSDLGANVLKIEDLNKQDYYRLIQPFIDGMNAGFAYINRNKRNLCLNLRSKEGAEIIKKLAKNYDVIIESFRSGVMDKWGIGYDALRKINPNIIYCAITGYGQTGTYADKPGHDINFIALSGVASITGTKDGEPILPGVQIADIAGCFNAVIAIQAAIISGEGNFIDISLTDSAIGFLSIHAAEYLASKKTPKPGDMFLNGRMTGYNFYRCKDGKHLSIAPLEPKFWKNFCTLIGKDDLLNEFLAHGKENDSSTKTLKDLFLTRTAADWMDLFKGHDVCVEIVNNLEEVFNHPYTLEREMLVSIKGVSQPGIPIKFTRNVAKPQRIAAPLGAHTIEILEKELNLDQKEIDLLLKEKIVLAS